MAEPRVYSPSTLLANYYDARKDPSFKGVRPPRAETEQQARNQETVSQHVPTYGAALKSTYAHIKSCEDALDYTNIIAPDTRRGAGLWATQQQSVHFGGGGHAEDSKSFTSHFTIGGGALVRDSRAMATYRGRWLNDGRGEAALNGAEGGMGRWARKRAEGVMGSRAPRPLRSDADVAVVCEALYRLLHTSAPS